MRQLCEYMRLPVSERFLLLQVTVLLWAVRLALWLLPFPTVQRTLALIRANVPQISRRLAADRIAWAVVLASQYVPEATCLTQALVTQSVLHRHGYPTVLHIGVAKQVNGQLEAHAWVESAGAIVIGGSAQELAAYTPLLALRDGQL